MSTDPDTNYYAERAAREWAMAERATNQAVQTLHREMAALYEAKAGRRCVGVRLVVAN